MLLIMSARSQTTGQLIVVPLRMLRGLHVPQAMLIMPALLPLLSAATTFDVVRTKNRFARNYDPQESAGYRDYQMLVRTKRGGWLFELQILPEEMYELKNSLGHEDYTKYRFAIEAADRARA